MRRHLAGAFLGVLLALLVAAWLGADYAGKGWEGVSYQRARAFAHDATTTLGSEGFWDGSPSITKTTSDVAAETTTGLFLRLTSTTAPSSAGFTWGSSAVDEDLGSLQPHVEFLVRQGGNGSVALTGTRFFCGLYNSASLNSVAADNNAGSLGVGVQFSNVSGGRADDTTWQFVAWDTANAQTLVASTVAPDDVPRYVAIDWTAAQSCTVSIYDADHVLLDDHTFTTELPAITDLLGISAAVRNAETNASQSLDVWHVELQARPQ